MSRDDLKQLEAKLAETKRVIAEDPLTAPTQKDLAMKVAEWEYKFACFKEEIDERIKGFSDTLDNMSTRQGTTRH